MWCPTWIVLLVSIGLVAAAPSCKDEKDEAGKQWALIVAGSNTSFNGEPAVSLAYAVQAVTYHAYHTLRDRGIPAEQIVLFSWDDAAFLEGYKYPGQLFNTPEKKDVRAGVAIDYKGSDVSMDNILAALSGNKSAVRGGTGRVIESTKNDKVFVYFMDHGGPNVFFLGDGSDFISKKSLHDTLNTMHSAQKYDQLTFYMDACHSGSMFDGLSSDLNIYAVTSASPAEDANAVFCPPINCTGDTSLQCEVGTCLGALFSNAWLADLEKSKAGEQLQTQFESVREIVKKAPEDDDEQKVSQWGDKSVAKESISTFEGPKHSKDKVAEFKPTGVVSFDDIQLHMYELLTRKLATERGLPKDVVEQRVNQVLQDYFAARYFYDGMLTRLTKHIVGDDDRAAELIEANVPLTQLDCHHDAFRVYVDKCPSRLGKNQQTLAFSSVISNICESGLPTATIIERINDYC